MKAKFILTTLSGFKEHGGNVTQERELTLEEEQDLRLSWDLYRKYLSDDGHTIKILDRVYGPGKWSSLIHTPEKRACWRVGYETQKMGGFYLDRDTNYDFRFAWVASQEGSVTGYDEYYRTLGASAGI